MVPRLLAEEEEGGRGEGGRYLSGRLLLIFQLLLFGFDSPVVFSVLISLFPGGFGDGRWAEGGLEGFPVFAWGGGLAWMGWVGGGWGGKFTVYSLAFDLRGCCGGAGWRWG